MIAAGFIFWGLFLVFAGVVVAYVGWMLWTERGGRDGVGKPR